MKTWNTVDGPITEDHLDSTVALIGQGIGKSEDLAARLELKTSDRRIDRALQLLAKSGRIKYDHHGRRWTVVEGGGK